MDLTPHEISERAREMADDPVVREILRRLEERAISDWRNSPANEPAKREAAYAALKVLENFKAQIHSMAIGPRVDAVNAKARERGSADAQALLRPTTK